MGCHCDLFVVNLPGEPDSRGERDKMIEMRKILISLAGLLLIFTAACCGGDSETGRKLDVAGSLIEAHPDSALVILTAINGDSISDSDTKSRLNVLKAYACYKNYLPLPPDSMLNSFISYYSDQKTHERMIALFLSASSLFESGKYEEAMRKLHLAKEIAVELGDNYWNAKTTGMMASIFRHTRNFKRWSEHSRESGNLFLACGEENRYMYERTEYAEALAYLNRIDESLEILDSLYHASIEAPVDTNLVAYILGRKYPLEHRYKDHNSSYNTYLLLQRYGDFAPNDANGKSELAILMMKNGKTEESEPIIAQAESLVENLIDSIAVTEAWKNYYYVTGDFAKSKKYMDSLLILTNMQITRILNESAMSGTADYYSDKATAEGVKSKNHRMLTILISLLAVILISGGYAIYRYRIKVKNAEIENKIQQIIILNDRIDSQEKETGILNDMVKEQQTDLDSIREEFDRHTAIVPQDEEISALFKDKLETLFMLCHKAYNLDSTDNVRNKLSNEIDRELKTFASPDFIDKIEVFVNLHMDGIIKDLRSECPFISSKDLILITLFLAGFKGEVISMILNLTRSNAFARKSRLKARIAKSDFSRRDFIVSKL